VTQNTSPFAAAPREADTSVHVVYCFDQNYEQHFGASVTSLLLNRQGPGRDLCIHVVTAEVTAAFQARLDRLTDTFRVRIAVHRLRPQDLERLSRLKTKTQTVTHLTTAAYYRVLLPHILSPDIDRVVYLDSDTIVLADIRALLDVDLGTAVVGAALDLGSTAMAAKRGLARYVNSGVMLMDLRGWRQGDYVDRCLDFALHNPEKISYGDQCAINAVCADAIHVLDPCWNRFVLSQTRSDDASGAAILHFITGDKPWQAWYENSLASLYWRYLDVSPWSGAVPAAGPA
jgi:UDP-glucose/galactose:(glucosyl)LPS alpha-1,2-glucosyl/galactosyltransferase